MQHCSYLGCPLGELVIKIGSFANSFKLVDLKSLSSSSFLKKLVENVSNRIQSLGPNELQTEKGKWVFQCGQKK